MPINYLILYGIKVTLFLIIWKFTPVFEVHSQVANNSVYLSAVTETGREQFIFEIKQTTDRGSRKIQTALNASSQDFHNSKQKFEKFNPEAENRQVFENSGLDESGLLENDLLEETSLKF